LLFWCLSIASQTSGLLLLLQGHVEVSQLDLADLSSVHRLAKQLSSEPSIDFLFLNAGVMACPQSYTKNGFEMQVGTNHFGHFELTHLLMDKFRQQVMHKCQNSGSVSRSFTHCTPVIAAFLQHRHPSNSKCCCVPSEAICLESNVYWLVQNSIAARTAMLSFAF